MSEATMKVKAQVPLERRLLRKIEKEARGSRIESYIMELGTILGVSTRVRGRKKRTIVVEGDAQRVTLFLNVLRTIESN